MTIRYGKNLTSLKQEENIEDKAESVFGGCLRREYHEDFKQNDTLEDEGESVFGGCLRRNTHEEWLKEQAEDEEICKECESLHCSTCGICKDRKELY